MEHSNKQVAADLIYVPSRPTRHYNRVLLKGGLLFIFFLLFYAYHGFQLITDERDSSQGRHDNDMFFQADSRYAVSAMADDRITHNRILLHPLFIMYVRPAGMLLKQLTGNPDITATVLCVLAGALGVFACWYFFTLLGIDPFRAVLYASVFGFSSSQLIFSIVPDTYIFSALGIIALLIVAQQRQKLFYWIAASLYLLGITLSNIVFALIAAYGYLFGNRLQLWKNRKKWAVYLSGIGVSFILLSLLQRAVYQVWMFRYLERADREGQFLFLPETWTDGLLRLKQLILHLFLFNVAAPLPSLVEHPLQPDTALLSFHASGFSAYPWYGMTGVLMWGALLGVAFWSIVRYKLYTHLLVRTLLLCLLFNAGLHSLYGEDLMLYSCHWTFFLMVLVFFSIEQTGISKRYPVAYPLLLLVFVLLLMTTNGQVVNSMLAAF